MLVWGAGSERICHQSGDWRSKEEVCKFLCVWKKVSWQAGCHLCYLMFPNASRLCLVKYLNACKTELQTDPDLYYYNNFDVGVSIFAHYMALGLCAEATSASLSGVIIYDKLTSTTTKGYSFEYLLPITILPLPLYFIIMDLHTFHKKNSQVRAESRAV